jgi:hypothetical protein
MGVVQAGGLGEKGFMLYNHEALVALATYKVHAFLHSKKERKS